MAKMETATAAPSSAPQAHSSDGVQPMNTMEESIEKKGENSVQIDGIGDLTYGTANNNGDGVHVLKSVHSGERMQQSLRFVVDMKQNTDTLVLCYVDPRGKLHHYYSYDNGAMDHDEGTFTGDAFVAYQYRGEKENKPITATELVQDKNSTVLCSYRVKLPLNSNHVHHVEYTRENNGSTSIQVTAALKQDDEYRICVGLPKKLCRLPPPEESWQVQYEYVCPPLPTSTSTWNSSKHTFYIWGDLDFDEYGASHFSNVPSHLREIHPCHMNQIVPQLMIGNCLAKNDATTYKPSWIAFDHWVIQAQYYWQASKSDSRAYCGDHVKVDPGDLIQTTIQYDADSGTMVVTIVVVDGQGKEVPDKKSEIVLPRPFMHDAALFSSWKDFFSKCVQAEVQHEQETKASSSSASKVQRVQENEPMRNPSLRGTTAITSSAKLGARARPCLNVEYKGRVDMETLKAVCPFLVKKATYPGLPEDNDATKWTKRFYCPRTGNTDVLEDAAKKHSLKIDDAVKLC